MPITIFKATFSMKFEVSNFKGERPARHQSESKHLHTCETVDVFITNKVFNAIDSKDLKVIVLSDFSKAFDTIDHCKLLVKLQSLGLTLSILEWFKVA